MCAFHPQELASHVDGYPQHAVVIGLDGSGGEAPHSRFQGVDAAFPRARQQHNLIAHFDAKIRGEAAFGEVPFLVTTFMDKATQEVRERWVTIPFEDWKEKYAPGDNP